MTKVFVSYCHKQGEWVWDRLVPVLKAGGIEVLIDRERFEAGKAVEGQMDATQDQADRHVLVLSPDYLNSGPCKHEMNRAIDLDPAFDHGIVIPVKRVECKLPNRIKRPNPLYVDLLDDSRIEPWDGLMGACGADLGVDVPQWLSVRDELRRDLELNRSVNLLVSGRDLAWRPLIEQLAEAPTTQMAVVDLHSGLTIQRSGLLSCMLDGTGSRKLSDAPADLAEFESEVLKRSGRSRVALLHFDHMQNRDYGADFFAALRYLASDTNKLVLLIESRAAVSSFVPASLGCAVSPLLPYTVELRGRK